MNSAPQAPWSLYTRISYSAVIFRLCQNHDLVSGRETHFCVRSAEFTIKRNYAQYSLNVGLYLSDTNNSACTFTILTTGNIKYWIRCIVCLCICQSLHLSLCLYIYPSICLSIHLSIYLSTCSCLFLNLPVHLPTYASKYPPTHLTAYLFIYMPIIFIHLSIYLSI